MFTEDDFVPISSLQHVVFCERQASLIYIENVWEENVFTAEGQILHDKAHSGDAEKKGDLIIARSLRLHSFEIGVTGMADVVEIKRISEGEKTYEREGILWEGVRIEKYNSNWYLYPIEYKRGVARFVEGNEVQLCAQAICLEEMLNTKIGAGALYYGKSNRRKEVIFNSEIRNRTVEAANRMRQLMNEDEKIEFSYSKKCNTCSLKDLCLPEITGKQKRVKHYIDKAFEFGINHNEKTP